MIKITIYGYTVLIDENTQIRKNFTVKELANMKAAAEGVPIYVINADTSKYMDMLQAFRDWYNKPMQINSCFRTKKYNASVGGSANSAHLYGTAADWWIKGHTDAQRENVKNRWEKILKENNIIGAINYYTDGYHLEAYSDKYFGAKSFTVRDYRGKVGDW